MALSNHILTIIEPSIKLDEYTFESFKEEEGKSNISDGLGAEKPLVIINGYSFGDADIQTLEIDSTGAIPIIKVSLVDNQAFFSVDAFPRDGDVLSLRIAARQKDVYKDLRIDFDIDDVQTPAQTTLTSGLASKFVFTGTMKVPSLYAEVCKSYPKDTSLNQLQSIAQDLGLGFATNIDAADDSMNMLIANDSIMDSIQKRVEHSYINDESFQTFSIDPYYYLNYVNINHLINSEEDFETIKVNFSQNVTDVKGIDKDANESEGALVLTSHSNARGLNTHIEKYALINRSGAFAKLNGYKKTLQYFENDSNEKLVSFDQEPLSSKSLKDIEEPLKGRRDEERYKQEVKTKYMGRIDVDPATSNTHINHNFARIHNKQNNDELQKMILEVQLEGFNPAIHRYQKLPILIFNETQKRIQADNQLKSKKEDKGFEATETSNDNGPSTSVTIDDFLSGFYVVGGIKYTYKKNTGKIAQTLTLYRREWPSRLNNIG
jgi:hypothetical protein